MKKFQETNASNRKIKLQKHESRDKSQQAINIHIIQRSSNLLFLSKKMKIFFYLIHLSN